MQEFLQRDGPLKDRRKTNSERGSKGKQQGTPINGKKNPSKTKELS